MYYEPKRLKFLLLIVALIIVLLFSIFCKKSHSEVIYSTVEVCDAIYRAEGGANAQYLYGIKSVKYASVTEAQEICMRTVRHARRDFNLLKTNEDFIEFLGRRYCPIGYGKNNKYWVKNVKWFIEHKNK